MSFLEFCGVIGLGFVLILLVIWFVSKLFNDAMSLRDEMQWERDYNSKRYGKRTRFSVRCFFRRHKWQKTNKFSPDCHHIEECSRCKALELSSIEHDWSEWKRIEGTCSEERICSRDGAKETREQEAFHIWSDWVKVEGKCLAVSHCVNCGKNRQNRNLFPHKWGEYSRIPDTCNAERFCTLCGERHVEGEYYEHIWSQWQYSDRNSNDYIRICYSCGETEEESG